VIVQESEIIKGCANGERRYQELLYKTFASRMFGLCLRFFRNREEAEDCLQEGFIKVFNYIKTYKGEGSFEGWIRKIMINTAINIYRTNQLLDNSGVMDDVSNFMSVSNYQTDNLSSEFLMRLIRELPDGYRQVFNLYAIEGYSHKEISVMLDISEGTSKSQLSRARVMLQQKIDIGSRKMEAGNLKHET
jgi:RNA polymerase sigma factor (sigma-70 family)